MIPLCGGNIDTTILGRCLERGLAADGRLIKFHVTVSDRPGGIADLAKLLCNLGVSIKDMVHERAWIKNDIFSVEVIVVVETRSAQHAKEMIQAVKTKYKKIHLIGVDAALKPVGHKSVEVISPLVSVKSMDVIGDGLDDDEDFPDTIPNTSSFDALTGKFRNAVAMNNSNNDTESTKNVTFAMGSADTYPY